MICLSVVHQLGQAGPALSACFGPQGGTIGRAATNTLVLEDPDRTVSRVHAQVVLRDGLYFIVDRGSNPMQCDGHPVGAGNEVPLRGGERLVIGGFELAVEVLGGPGRSSPARDSVSAAAGAAQANAAAGFADDPFADLLAGLGSPPPVVVASGSGHVGKEPAIEPGASARPDLLGVSAASPSGKSTPDDPFADLLASPSSGGKPASVGHHSVVVDDFSDLSGAPALSRSTDIDALFGPSIGLGGDPLALSPLADPLRQPNTAGNPDPLVAFGVDMRPTAAPRADHLPIGNFGFDPPASETPRVAMPVSAPAPKTAPQIPDPALLADDTALPLLSADAGDPFAGLLDEADIARPLDPANRAPSKVGAAPAPPTIAQGQTPAPKNASSAVAASEHKRASASPPTPALAQQAIAPVAIPPQSPPPVAAVASAASATTSGFASPSALEAELLTAFLRGLAATHQAPTSLTPELMERIGTMMRSATEGTLQLLLARQEFKREVRAEVTVIASQANNPLKFSPTVDVALAHLLGPGVRGFMPAEEAMRDAYNDLRSHQFGVMVGLRAALAHALSRFEPAVLEKKISAKSKLDALFAANRKAKLWDQFVALYADLATEAEDDFHSLFGKAFLQAYEEQMARLKDAGKN